MLKDCLPAGTVTVWQMGRHLAPTVSEPYHHNIYICQAQRLAIRDVSQGLLWQEYSSTASMHKSGCPWTDLQIVCVYACQLWV